MLVTDLTDSYLTIKKGKKIGNLKKIEKKYSLSFKGLLASLNQTALQDVFWIKHYIQFIEKITDKITADYFLYHMYYHVTSFLVLNSYRSGMLTHNQSPEDDFYGNYSGNGINPDGFLHQTHIKNIPSQFRDLFIYLYEKFHTSSEVMGYLVKKSMKNKIPIEFNNEESNLKFQEIVDLIFRQWMWQIFLTLNHNSDKFLKSIVDDDGSIQNNFNDESDDAIDMIYEFGDELWDNLSFMAADEINRLLPQENLSGVDYVNNKSEIDSLISPY